MGDVFRDHAEFIRYLGRDCRQGAQTFLRKKNWPKILFGWKRRGEDFFWKKKKGRGLSSKEKRGRIVFWLQNLNLSFLKKAIFGQEIIILEKGDCQVPPIGKWKFLATSFQLQKNYLPTNPLIYHILSKSSGVLSPCISEYRVPSK